MAQAEDSFLQKRPENLITRSWSGDEVNAVHCRSNVTATKQSDILDATNLHSVFSEVLIIDGWCLGSF